MAKHIKSIQDLPSIAVKKFNEEVAGLRSWKWVVLSRPIASGSKIKCTPWESKHYALDQLRNLRENEETRWVFMAKLTKDKEGFTKKWTHPLLNKPEEK